MVPGRVFGCDITYALKDSVCFSSIHNLVLLVAILLVILRSLLIFSKLVTTFDISALDGFLS